MGLRAFVAWESVGPRAASRMGERLNFKDSASAYRPHPMSRQPRIIWAGAVNTEPSPGLVMFKVRWGGRRKTHHENRRPPTNPDTWYFC